MKTHAPFFDKYSVKISSSFFFLLKLSFVFRWNSLISSQGAFESVYCHFFWTVCPFSLKIEFVSVVLFVRFGFISAMNMFFLFVIAYSIFPWKIARISVVIGFFFIYELNRVVFFRFNGINQCVKQSAKSLWKVFSVFCVNWHDEMDDINMEPWFQRFAVFADAVDGLSTCLVFCSYKF